MSRKISIHALREEGDRPRRKCASVQRYFYPRPPRGGRLPTLSQICAGKTISIHALREEGDSASSALMVHAGLFLSTPSARRATFHRQAWPACLPISIHALREEGDLNGPEYCRKQVISIHALREEGDRSRRKTKRRRSISIHALREEGDISSFSKESSIRKNFYPRPPRGGRQQKQRQNLYFQTNYTTFCTNLEEP